MIAKIAPTLAKGQISIALILFAILGYDIFLRLAGGEPDGLGGPFVIEAIAVAAGALGIARPSEVSPSKAAPKA